MRERVLYFTAKRITFGAECVARQDMAQQLVSTGGMARWGRARERVVGHVQIRCESGADGIVRMEEGWARLLR
jgi:hypothetical protein